MADAMARSRVINSGANLLERHAVLQANCADRKSLYKIDKGYFLGL